MAVAEVLAGLLVGFLLGVGAAWVFKIIHLRSAREIADELFKENEQFRREDIKAVKESLSQNFGNLSLQALEKFRAMAHEQFSSERELHSKELEGKKSLIDQQLVKMTEEMEKVKGLMTQLEKDRELKFGELASHLKETNRRTDELTHVTATLKEALAGTKSRGQWGERMAEDVLHIAGFVENVNYHRQKAISGSGNIPDFTFLLPGDRRLNMDVKFPYDNYIRYLEAESDGERDSYRKSFLRDVKGRIKEITTRDYINPEQNTVDYVLLFIPNEQIYTFIQEQDATILDEGLHNRVIVCSPITLFAVLAVIRAAVDNFALEQASNRILSLMGTFHREWGKFLDALEKIGTRIDSARKAFDDVTGPRKRQLEKPLREIDAMRTDRGIAIGEMVEDGGSGDDGDTDGAGE